MESHVLAAHTSGGVSEFFARLLTACALVGASAAGAGEHQATAIINARILTATSPQIEAGTLVFKAGRIISVGREVSIPEDALIIDAKGRWVTPGLIDPHSHLGVYPTPLLPSTMDLNEKSGNNTAEVSAESGIWPQDPGFEQARRGGVTSMAILPGSSNMIGGRGITVKNVVRPSAAEMKFPGAPEFLKMSCGENPIKVYGGQGKAPFTRMAVAAEFRKAWAEAARYRKSASASAAGQGDLTQDYRLEAMAGVLNGDIIPIFHCYRADEMVQMIEIAHEFRFRIGAFHHATEAYKIAALLASENISVATWARRWGFKMEAYDAPDAGVAMLESAGVEVALHSDNAILIQRMNIEASLALAAARRAGLKGDRALAIRWITLRPAKLMGIEGQTGSLEPGKMSDIVLWSEDPFSIYARADKVYIDGVLVHDRGPSDADTTSDFLTGQQPATGE